MVAAQEHRTVRRLDNSARLASLRAAARDAGVIAPGSHTGDDEMGRGDKRSRKGKIYRGSYGKTRPGKLKKKARKAAKKSA
jgi:30S ribosomal protein S31